MNKDINEKEKPDQLNILERMIDEEIRQINSEIMCQQTRKSTLESVKNDIESVRQRFSPDYQKLFQERGTPK